MMKWLRKHFIPHADNFYRPRALGYKSTRRIIVLVLALELIFLILPTLAGLGLSGGLAAVLPAVLGDLTNKERQAENLPALAENPLLVKAAQMKAEDMAKKGYFAHISPEGRTPWYWIELAGYRYQYAGENLAVNFHDSEDVTAAWLKSPTHKANIIKKNYTEMGTGIARGSYKGRPSVFVAQVYANPLPYPATILPAAVAFTQAPLAQRLAFSPRHALNIALAAIFIVLALTLAFYVYRTRGHHKDILGNGLAALAIIGALAVANYYLSFNSMIVAESYDYALEDTI